MWELQRYIPESDILYVYIQVTKPWSGHTVSAEGQAKGGWMGQKTLGHCVKAACFLFPADSQHWFLLTMSTIIF